MSNVNGYFQLVHKEDGTYLNIFPPMAGGEPFSFQELTQYLSNKITDYDLTTLHHAVMTAKEKTEIKLSMKKILPVSESLRVNVAPDRLSAVGRFYPPSSEGKLMSKKDIESELVFSGVKFGMLTEIVDNFMVKRRYCEDIVLAEAMLPIEGNNAQITYHFSTTPNAKPKINEDGTVDFHQLDMISHVNKGDVLATLIPVDLGKPGIDVCGNLLKPKKVTNRILRHGKNIYLSEDGLTMYSDVSGHAFLVEDRVTVSDTYEVAADVDASTGDINYEGNVLVRGNVITGFSVRAKGDIIVNGVVEGATLEAEGQIILKRGIQGMNRGKLYAKGNIITKFIENSEVYAGGYITTEAIMHSKVSAKGDIISNGRRGMITGGEIRSGSLISAKTVGSTMGTATLLEVGVDPKVLEDYRAIEKEIVQVQSDREKIIQILTLLNKKISMGEKISTDKLLYLKQANENKVLLDTKVENLTKQYESLQIEMENDTNGRIRVEGVGYPGVKIVISNVVYYIRDEVNHSQFVRDRADIRVLAI